MYSNDVPDLVVANPNGSPAFFVEGSYTDLKTYGSSSADGGKLVYLRHLYNRGSYSTDLYRVEVVDRNKNLLATFDNLADPARTPDGHLIMAGIPDADTRGLFLTDQNLQNPWSLSASLSSSATPAVSPGGSKVAFSMDGHIWTVRRLSRSPRQATRAVAWSPNGRIIFRLRVGYEDYRIAIVPADPDAPTYIDETLFLYVTPPSKTYKAYLGTPGRMT